MRKFLGYLIILGVAGLAIYYFYLTYIRPPQRDYTAQANRLEREIDQFLVSRKIDNTRIIKIYHEEKTEREFRWIRTKKEIQLPPEESFKSLETGLRQVAAKLQLRVINIWKSPDSTRLEIGIGIQDVVLETLIFRRAAEQRECRAAIIIDDCGYNASAVEKFLTLQQQFTFAILPGERSSKTIAERVSRAGYEVLLHQPMEPHGYPGINVGKRAIILGMSAEKIRIMLEMNLQDIPRAVGVNNHMGSRLTEEREPMEYVVRYLKERGLFYVDSYTSTRSVAYSTAKAMGLPTLRNQVFLDEHDSLEYIKKQLDKVGALALKHGRVIAIGHAERRFIIPALAEKLPKFKEKGIEIVPVSELLE